MSVTIPGPLEHSSASLASAGPMSTSPPAQTSQSHYTHGLGDSLLPANETKVCYQIDDQEPPFLIKLPFPSGNIRLKDLKANLQLRRHFSQYKYYFKSHDKEFGVVKEEISDDNAILPIFQGRVVAWLVTIEGSTFSDSSNSQCLTEISAADRLAAYQNGQQRSGKRVACLADSRPAAHAFHHCDDNSSTTTTETESMMSSRRAGNFMNSPHRMAANYNKHGRYPPNRLGQRYGDSSDLESTSFVDSDDDDDDDEDEYLDETGGDDDYDDYEDFTSRVSTTTEETSVSRQCSRKNRRRRFRRAYSHEQQMSRTSSLSSITDSSMSVNAMTVTLNLDESSYLGISLVGHTTAKGDLGIFVNQIMKGGAVDLDGRIETGDLILQVNDISIRNMSNDRAVEIIREAVQRPGPIKLLVAKTWDSSPKMHFTIPRSEPVHPIDPGAWVAHTEAARAKFSNPEYPDGYNRASSIANDFDGQYQPPTAMLPPVGSPLHASFKLSKTGSSVSAPGTTAHLAPGSMFLTKESSFEAIAMAMVAPDSTLDVRERIWLKIPVPCAFLGSDAVNWIYENVRGFKDRKEVKKLLTRMLKEGYIIHPIPISKSSKLSEKCYYQVSDEIRAKLSEQTMVNTNLGDNFETNFANTLHLTNENVQRPNLIGSTIGSESATGATNPKYMMPFMKYWDETSEIQNYGVLGPNPLEAKDNSDRLGTSCSDEQSQRSGQSVLLNPKMLDTIGLPHLSHSNTLASNGSSASCNGRQLVGCNTQSHGTMLSNNSGSGGAGVHAPNANGNLLNHHYEDLQMNHETGNLVASSLVNSTHGKEGSTSASVYAPQAVWS